jgi:GntR family transcriptional regulator, arabinose operon transcriptional repressor
MAMLEVWRENSLPLHIQLLNDLRHKVMTGVLQPHERLPSEWELVTTLGISRATVQHAWQAAEQEGLIYRVAGKGTFVSEPRSKSATQRAFGLVIPDFRSSTAANTLSGAERVLRQRNYSVRVASTEYARDEEDRVLQQMIDDEVDGCILWAVKGPGMERYLAKITGTFPVVLIDRPLDGLKLPCVTSNNYTGGRQATGHLLNLGHQQIAFLARPHLELWTVAERYRGYQDAMRAAGLEPLQPVLIGDEKELSSFNAYLSNDDQSLEPLVDCLRQPDRPTAIFAVNDWMAIRALRAARYAGLRVPDDLSLVGFDDLDIVDYLTPPLTTIAQNYELIGAEAARRLLAMAEDEVTEDMLTLVPTRLILRQSTAPLA